ncbi:MAG: SIS domain-containing protein [Candidatus Paceibacterota bacterium]|jgi:glucose/mannose-6-phosphate isomerase
MSKKKHIIEKNILDFPLQIKSGLERNFDGIGFDRKFKNILVCGMGGSALAAEFLKKFYPIRIHRNYELPVRLIDKDTLIICVSYSGNTEEIVSAYDVAIRNGLPAVVLSSGGILKTRSLKEKVPFIEILTKDIEPRMSVIEQICILKRLFDSLKIKPHNEKSLEIKSVIVPENFVPQAKIIAKNLIDKVPLVYASIENKASAIFWKALLNENAKVPAFWNVFPEINHNEFMHGQGITWSKKFHILSLIDDDDHIKVKNRMRLSIDMLKRKGFGANIIKIEGFTPFEKIINSIVIGNWISYFLAKELKIDPSDPDVREEFKKLISQT